MALSHTHSPSAIQYGHRGLFAPSLAALHNFIWKNDPSDLADIANDKDPQPGMHGRGGPAAAAKAGQLAEGLAGAVEKWQANERQDRIAQEMWTQYQAELLRCNHDE
jgi:hypothetical protein